MRVNVPDCPKCGYNPAVAANVDAKADPAEIQVLMLATIAHMLTHLVER